MRASISATGTRFSLCGFGETAFERACPAPNPCGAPPHAAPTAPTAARARSRRTAWRRSPLPNPPTRSPSPPPPPPAAAAAAADGRPRPPIACTDTARPPTTAPLRAAAAWAPRQRGLYTRDGLPRLRAARAGAAPLRRRLRHRAERRVRTEARPAAPGTRAPGHGLPRLRSSLHLDAPAPTRSQSSLSPPPPSPSPGARASASTEPAAAAPPAGAGVQRCAAIEAHVPRPPARARVPPLRATCLR